MKKNTSQEKDRRIQFTHPQKTSFLSVSPRNDNSHMFSGQPGEMKRHDTCQNIEFNKIHKIKHHQGAINLVEDTQSTKHFSKRENHMSTQNLRISFKGKGAINKNVRESQNIPINDYNKTPPNSLKDKKLTNSKSASNLAKPSQEFLVIKSDNSIKQLSNVQDSQEIKQILKKIEQMKSSNDKIQQQNLQLRLQKLQYYSVSLQMSTLRKQIGEMKRKIERLKEQNMRIEENYNSYYSTRVDKNSASKKNLHNPIPYQKQRNSNLLPLSRTASSLSNNYLDIKKI